MSSYQFLGTKQAPVKAWTEGVPVERAALEQLRNMAGLPFVFKHVAAMPDVHLGRGATVGSVIPTKGAIVPAAVGVDIGCGMCVRSGPRSPATSCPKAWRGSVPPSRARCRSDEPPTRR